VLADGAIVTTVRIRRSIDLGVGWDQKVWRIRYVLETQSQFGSVAERINGRGIVLSWLVVRIV
jgi:hypothetical protein